MRVALQGKPPRARDEVIWYQWYQWYHQSMAKSSAPISTFHVGHQFKSREARDNFSGLLDEAANGGVAVVQREEQTFVLVTRAAYDAALADRAPFAVRSSVHDGQFSLWLDDVPVHAVGESLDQAEDEFLDALIDYADLWLSELRHAPNHRSNAEVVHRIVAYAADRAALSAIVFGV